MPQSGDQQKFQIPRNNFRDNCALAMHTQPIVVAAAVDEYRANESCSKFE